MHSMAQQQARCLIAMAGLAPGLTGLLARKMLTSTPNAEKVQVSLLQNSSGTAGKQGSLDMVNLLTDPMCIYKSRPYPNRHGKDLSTRKMFDFFTPELEFMVEANEIHFVTGFNNRYMNSAMATMAVVRRLSPSIFRWLRDTVADAKARASVPVLRENEEMMYQFEYDYRFDSSKIESAFGLQATPYRQGISESLRSVTPGRL